MRRFGVVVAVVLALALSGEVARELLPVGPPAVPRVEVDVAPLDLPPPSDDPAAVAPPRPLVLRAAPGRIVVDVVDDEGDPIDEAWVVPLDCPGFISSPPGEYLVGMGPCTLIARRVDGMLIARSTPAMAVVRDGALARVTLVLPRRRTGGIGIRFQPDDGGMRVVEVVPGTPADEAGLAPGDVILAIGDAPVAGMDTDQFVTSMTGEEGTDVEFTVRPPDETERDSGTAEQRVRVTRAYLDG
jgi:membrane-associated protease RseP (regulator of RpoE activity)